jgi:hypothetical protein
MGATLTKPQNSSLDAESADLRVPQPPDSVPWFGPLILGIYFFGIAAITFYLLVATWPVSDPKNGSGFAELSLFGSASFSAPPDLRLFFTVIAAGALGSLIHSITSFADYVGKPRNVQWISDTSLAITLLAEDLSVKTELQLIVQNPGPGEGDSEPFHIPVENV